MYIFSQFDFSIYSDSCRMFTFWYVTVPSRLAKLNCYWIIHRQCCKILKLPIFVKAEASHFANFHHKTNTRWLTKHENEIFSVSGLSTLFYVTLMQSWDRTCEKSPSFPAPCHVKIAIVTHFWDFIPIFIQPSIKKALHKYFISLFHIPALMVS